MASRTVRDIVGQQELLWIGPGASVSEAVARMDARNVAAILVIDHGVVAGIFTERDLLKRVVAKACDPTKTPVAAVMTREPVTVSVDVNALAAMRTMRRHNIRHLPVTDGLRAVGIVSIRDFVGGEISAFERERDIQEHLWEG